MHQKGDNFFAQGDAADAIFYITNGKVKVTCSVQAGKGGRRRAPEYGRSFWRRMLDWTAKAIGDRNCDDWMWNDASGDEQGHDTRAIQDRLGHRSITSTAVYTALAPNRFKDFWREWAFRLIASDQASFCRSARGLVRSAAFGLGFSPTRRRVMLGLESCEHVIGMILDNVGSDRTSIDPAFRSCFDVNVRHRFSFLYQPSEMARAAPAGGTA
jgi:hypothetical protein